MTVCIGAVNMFGDIVTASDQMLSMGDGAFTAESVALKDCYLNDDWRAMFAGEDVGLVPGLMDRIRSQISYGEQIQSNKMAQILAQSFQAERREQAAAAHLGSYGISMQEFLSNGIHLFGESGAAVIRERIESHRLGLELLVVGHDGGKPTDKVRSAALLSVSDPGVVRNHNVAMFWAIGSGAYLALSSLATRRQSGRIATPTMLYHVCEAKFVSEAALGVGQETFVTVHRPNRSWAWVNPAQMKAIRKQWERIGKPRSTRTVAASLREWQETAKWHDVPEDQPKSETSSSSDQT